MILSQKKNTMRAAMALLVWKSGKSTKANRKICNDCKKAAIRFKMLGTLEIRKANIKAKAPSKAIIIKVWKTAKKFKSELKKAVAGFKALTASTINFSRKNSKHNFRLKCKSKRFSSKLS